MYQILENSLENFYNDIYLIQTCSQAKSSGIKLLEVHGVEKSLKPNLRPEKQHTFSKKGNLERPQIDQGRAGSKRKKPDPINQPAIKLLTGNSWKNQNRNKENKQHPWYKQCK